MAAHDDLSAGRWRRQVSNPPLLIWLFLLLMLGFTAYVSSLVYREVDTAANAAFQRNITKALDMITLRLDANEQILRGGIGLFKASTEVNRQDWHDYVESLNLAEHFPGIQGLGYAVQVHPAALPGLTSRIRKEGYSDFAINPGGIRDVYTAIIYLEPFDIRNRRAFGYDMFSESTRHAAMAQARDSGLATISGKVKLLQETGTDVQAGFLMYLPNYARNMPLDTVEQRRRALLGYVYSPLRMNNLMQGVLGRLADTHDIDIEIYDGRTPSSDTLMYDVDSSMTGQDNRMHKQFIDIRHLQSKGREWTLVFSSTPLFESGIDHSRPVYVAVTGIAISLLLFFTGSFLANNRKQAHLMLQSMNLALTEQKGLINAIVDDAADGIITIDEHGKVLSFNHAASHIFGYLPSEMIGRNINMLMPEPYHSSHDSYLSQYMKTGNGSIIGIGREVSGLRKSGEVFPMDLSVSEVMTGARSRIFSGIVRDITERKKAEADLRRSEERFNLAISGAKDGLWDLDINNKISYHSPRWNSLIGLPEQESMEQAGSWAQHVHPDDKPVVQKMMQDYLEGKIPEFVCEYRVRHVDGYYIWILNRGILQRDEHGKVYRMVGIISDISKQKQVENLKSEFVSTVSHELRTPLTSIKGALGLVTGGATGEVNPQMKQMLDIAYKNSDRLLALINDLLDIEKIQSGKMEFNFQPQRLMPLIEQVVGNNQSYAAKYRVEYRIAHALPDVMLNVDGDRFIQVMANLLSNAAKFSHEGGIINIEVQRHNGMIRTSVIDYGEGIPTQYQARIFEKFTQADSTDTRHKGGTGLGLSISKAMIESMHGRIGFASKAGSGTTFFIDFTEWHQTEA